MALKQMSGKEFVEKILKGERDFSRVILEGCFDLSGHESYGEVQNYLKNQDLKKTPFNISYSEFIYIQAKGLHLPYTIGVMVDFRGANISEANLNEAKFKKGCFNNANLEKVILEKANLYNASFCEANLEGAILRGACLNVATLLGANLYRAKFEEADLVKANLAGADLGQANFDGANLEGATLVGANLVGTYLERTYLDGAEFSGGDLEKARILGMYLHAPNFDEEKAEKLYQEVQDTIKGSLEEKVQDTTEESFGDKVIGCFGGVIGVALICGLFYGGFSLIKGCGAYSDKILIKKAIKEDMALTYLALPPTISYRGNVECMTRLDDNYDIKSIEVNGESATATVEITYNSICGDCSVYDSTATFQYKLESRHTLAEGYVWEPISTGHASIISGPKESIIKYFRCLVDRIF